MQAYDKLCEIVYNLDGIPRRPPKNSKTRWAGFLPVCAWVNEFKVAIQLYDESPAEGCVENEDGTVYNDHCLEEGQWVDVAQLDAVLRPVGPFIETMEATKKIIVSLVLPMVGLLLKALDPSIPVVVKDYSDIKKPTNVVVNVRHPYIILPYFIEFH